MAPLGLVGRLVFLTALGACSGESRVQRTAPGETGGTDGGGAGGSGGVSGSGNAAGATEPDGTVSIDDVDHAAEGYPEAPEGAFFWSHGLGYWFVLGEGDLLVDARVDAIIPPRDGSTKAYRVSNFGYARGVDLLAQLDHPGFRPVDLGAYRGFGFYARLGGASDELVVALNPTGTRTYFGALDAGEPFPSVALTVTPEWQRYELSFDEFGLDDSNVASIDFVAGAGAGPFDLWIDDLSFRCRGACPE